MIKNKWYALDVKNEVAEISIFDEIGGFGTSVAEFKNQFDLIKDKPEIKLLINSPGGAVTEGMALYNILSTVRSKLTIEVIGLAASIASVVALAGKELVMGEGTYFMIHNPWTITWGDADDLRKTADVLDKLKGEIVNIYSAHCALLPEEITKMMDEETWLTADETVEAGFASRVEEYAQAAACAFDLSKIGFKRAPLGLMKNQAAIAPEKLEGIMDVKPVIPAPVAVVAPVVAPQAAPQPGLNDVLTDDKLAEMLAGKLAPALARLLPAGRALEAKTKDDKFPGWFLDALRGKNLRRGIPMDVAAVIKTSDGFGVPIPAWAEVLQNLNFYSIARRWGALSRGVDAGKTKITTNVVQNAADIIAETGDYPDLGEPTGIELDLYKIGGRYSMTEETDEDSVIDAFSDFAKEAAVALAKGENTYFLLGTGSSQPRGIFQETAAKIAASATAITLAELIELDELIEDEWDTMEQFDPRNPGAYRGPIYVMKGSTAAYVRAMKDTDSKYIFQEYYNGKMLTMFGRPVVRYSGCAAIAASAKVISLVNFAGYLIGQRRPGLALKVGEDQDSHAILWDFNERVGGKIWNTAAVKTLIMHHAPT